MNKHLFIGLAFIAVVISGCKEKEKPENGNAMFCGQTGYAAEHPKTCKDWEKYFTPKKEAVDLMKKLSE